MRNYFMYENKRRNKFVIEYLKLFATDRHWLRGIKVSRENSCGTQIGQELFSYSWTFLFFIR